MTKQIITQKRLKELLDYDPETGIFTNKPSRKWCKAGEIAGTKNKAGYIQIEIDRIIYLAHRLVYVYIGYEIPQYVDHINQCKSDNAWDNLREVSFLENMRNMPRRSDNKSGIVGVSWCKEKNKWLARIKTEERAIHLGYFEDIEKAAAARKAADIKYGFHKNHGLSAS